MAHQFLVPQFIDVEPKIIGPITVRQFILMVIAMVIIFIFYKFSTFWTFIIATVLILGLFGVLAFAKINGRPFHYFILNIVETLKRPRLKVWDKTLDMEEVKALMAYGTQIKKVEQIAKKEPLAESHLEELSLIVNTGGAYQSSELDLNYDTRKEK
ncbi:MAG: PrgI family protein [Patescibacteria group bacterium]|jgi:hypothetical protein